ncbi:MAG: CoA transferase [Actinomycetota bacterium]|nr:CoA transferase [Actinomycetota bacterium]MDQ6945712.1 CoA transferase [Actinomycetota bacterium]
MSVPLVHDVLADLGVSDSGRLELTGDPNLPLLSSPLAVTECAVSSVAACLMSAADLSLARCGRRPEIALDTEHVAVAVRSEAWLRDPAGHDMSGFAPLSRLWPTADGWVRTHANYPWHRAALLAALDETDGADADVEAGLGDALAQRSALDIERVVYEAGGLAVAARSVDEWQQSEPGRAAATSGLVTTEPLGMGVGTSPMAFPGGLPASGLKVLDLTRVIAGPVGTRMLGALGADVLRVDDPNRPELPLHTVDGVIGKASAIFDATTKAGVEVLHVLLDGADVLVTGYRPGALRRLGLDPDQVAERHPGTVVVTLSAWGTSGPWGARRGFDSLVQIASGIGWATSRDGQRPGSLPCQLLDHATGYLVAAGALAALATRARTGQASHVSLSLARTAQWLLEQGVRAESKPATPEEAELQADAYRTPLGDGWSSISPPGRIDGESLRWPHLPPRYAQAEAAWR